MGADGTGRGAPPWLSRWPSASSPVRVPSSTGMPPARNSAATAGSMAAGRLLSTTTGLLVRCAAAATARG